jgi:EAL domain-containing protein (putative c-di-GMP-specific phosphodiesterase class I)
MCLNVSPLQLRRPGFARFVAGVLQEHAVPAATLELEIKESVLMAYNPENVKILQQLADIGISLAVDDFGTGYSNLAFLRRFPIQSLKMDQSFVQGIGKNPNDTAIVTAVIAMANSLHLRVLADGVETPEQVTFLRWRGCFAAQGAHYAAPLPAAAFGELLQRPPQPPAAEADAALPSPQHIERE